MIQVWAVEYRRKPNPRIVNPRPHSWRKLAVRDNEREAREYRAELAQGAKECALPYAYRVRAEMVDRARHPT